MIWGFPATFGGGALCCGARKSARPCRQAKPAFGLALWATRSAALSLLPAAFKLQANCWLEAGCAVSKLAVGFNLQPQLAGGEAAAG